MEKVTGTGRGMHRDLVHNLYFSLNIIRVNKSRGVRWAGRVARVRERSCAYRVLDWKPGGKRPLRRPRRRWKDNIKIIF